MVRWHAIEQFTQKIFIIIKIAILLTETLYFNHMLSKGELKFITSSGHVRACGILWLIPLLFRF